MRISQVFISRPGQEARELAGLLAPLGLQAIVQPAFEYASLDLRASDPQGYARFEAAGPGSLVVFTSPRAVQHGLAQLPRQQLSQLRVAAIGPATAAALAAAGVPAAVADDAGYTSEALLKTLAAKTPGEAFIVAAPGGRGALLEGLSARGWRAGMLMVYQARAAELDPAAVAALGKAEALLSVWTSGNAMNALAQRLPPAAWFRVCRGEWLVISERLKRLARAYGPSRIHLADGPGNEALLAAVRRLL
jgi:uroporphyrinogen-III synthase